MQLIERLNCKARTWKLYSCCEFEKIFIMSRTNNAPKVHLLCHQFTKKNMESLLFVLILLRKNLKSVTQGNNLNEANFVCGDH